MANIHQGEDEKMWLERVQSILPEFSLEKCDQVSRLTIEPSTSGQGVDIEVEIDHASTHLVTLRFVRVSQVHIPDLPFGCINLVEFTIADLTGDGMENVRFKVADEVTGLSLQCMDVLCEGVNEVS